MAERQNYQDQLSVQSATNILRDPYLAVSFARRINQIKSDQIVHNNLTLKAAKPTLYEFHSQSKHLFLSHPFNQSIHSFIENKL
jgi:hypothetical protein